MHRMEVEPALQAIARQLGPGGTFCAGLWGMLQRVEEEADEVWMRIMESVTKASTDVLRPERTRQTSEIQDSGYDTIALSENVWCPGVQRVKLNASKEDAFRMNRVSKDDFPIVSRVGRHDEMVFQEDCEWLAEMDLVGLKAHTESFPGRPPVEIVDPFWREMESILAGGKCKGFFPASLILATKK